MGTLDARAGLAGKVAAVIGGAAGIGAAVSEALGSAGVDVALCDHNAPAIEGMRARLASLGRAVLAEALDVISDRKAVLSYKSPTSGHPGTPGQKTEGVKFDPAKTASILRD